jgi:microcompartment protein CcmL/EutN
VTVRPAIALLEFDSIARGIEAGDAMSKRAPLELVRTGTVEPGRYLVLVGGTTADVEEALQAGREAAAESLLDVVFLADVHPDVMGSLAGARRTDDGEALGVIEAGSVAATIDAADAGVKGARVTIRDLRLADDLGGKGYVLFGGPVAQVEAAVGYGVDRIAPSGQAVAHAVIARLHDEMRENLAADPRFAARSAGVERPSDRDAVTTIRPPARAHRPMPGSGPVAPPPTPAPTPTPARAGTARAARARAAPRRGKRA